MQVELVKSGDNFFKTVYKIIHGAKTELHLQTYIFADDLTGLEVANALAKAVERGVKVFLLVDAFGSHELKSDTIESIKKHGINFRTYSPLLSGKGVKFGRRLHHKILVADGSEALVGGTNIDDKYHIEGAGTPWLDYAIYVKGDICEEIAVICEKLWNGNKYFRRRRPQTPKGALTGMVELKQNDWVRGKKEISLSLNNAIRHAQSEVVIMASYFLPGMKIRNSLRNASKRKVKVKLILPGLSDVRIVQHATKYWYAWMLRNNFEIYEWDKTILHGKVNMVDNEWVSIGSYNINHLSKFSSVETNVEVSDKVFCKSVADEFETVMKSCAKITVSEYKETMNLLEKFRCWLSFRIVRFLFQLQFKILSKE